MNKKIIIGIVAVVLLIVGGIVFIAINNGSKQEESRKNENNAKEVLDNSNSDSKILVAYFSMAGQVYNVGDVEVGNTALMASYMVDYLKADSFEIVPVNAYPTTHNELLKVAQDEQNSNARPEIKNKINIDDYDTIFIGYPIWWGDMPQIIYTFMEEYDFRGKTVIPFNTHEGSGSSGTYSTVKNKLSNATVKDGLALQGKTARTDEGKTKTVNWLKELGY